MTQKGHGQGHVTYFLNFGTHFIIFEPVKVDTSFSYDRSVLASTIKWTMNYPTGGCQCHMTYFFKFYSTLSREHVKVHYALQIFDTG